MEDNGQIIGQRVTDHTRLEIANTLSKIEPPVSVDRAIAAVFAEQLKLPYLLSTK